MLTSSIVIATAEALHRMVFRAKGVPARRSACIDYSAKKRYSTQAWQSRLL